MEKSLEMIEAEWLRKEEESNPKEYAKVHCIETHNSSTREPSKNIQLILLWQPNIDFRLILYM